MATGGSLGQRHDRIAIMSPTMIEVIITHIIPSSTATHQMFTPSDFNVPIAIEPLLTLRYLQCSSDFIIPSERSSY